MKKIKFSTGSIEFPNYERDIRFKIFNGAIITNPTWPKRYVYYNAKCGSSYEITYHEMCFLKLGGELNEPS